MDGKNRPLQTILIEVQITLQKGGGSIRVLTFSQHYFQEKKKK
ncbi:hypothetical protein ACJROX_07075 [Pseudalkalibacillus sp. A8]